MNRVLIIIILLFISTILPLYSYAYAEGQGPIGLSPIGIPRTDEQIGRPGISPEQAERAETQKMSWFDKQIRIMSLADKKGSLIQKSIGQIYKRLSDQENWNKNYSLQRRIEVEKKVTEIGNTISAYGETFIIRDDKSVIRYFDGRPTAILYQKDTDNWGHTNIVNYLNISYEDKDNFVPSNFNTTSTHMLGYDRLIYNPKNIIDYFNFDDTEYFSNIDDLPSKYTTIEGSTENNPAWDISEPRTVPEANSLYKKLINDVLPEVQSAIKYKVTTIFSNVTYFDLSQNTATATTPGGFYGEKSSYNFELSTTAAPDVTETGKTDDILFFSFDRPPADIPSKDKYWWHAQNATEIYVNSTKEAREASSHTTITRLGITKEINFFNASYDTSNYHNALTVYEETYKIGGTQIASYNYSNITRDSYGRETGYTLNADIYGEPYRREYSNITYDSLSRISGYEMKETLAGTTTSYKYWGIIYNDLWQETSYYYSIDGVEHFRSEITYNSYGLVASYKETYVDNGVNVTTYVNNTYNSNGLISSYTEEILRQSDTIKEYYYIYTGNIAYNSIYAITSFDRITIKDTNAAVITDYSSKIPLLLAGLTYDGTNPYTTSGVWSIWGFNGTTTIYIENWRLLTYYSVGGYTNQANYYDLSISDFRGRLSGYKEAKRTVTSSSDSTVIITLP